MSSFTTLHPRPADAIVKVPTTADLPAFPQEGDIRYIEDLNAVVVYTGAAWDSVGAASTLQTAYDAGNFITTITDRPVNIVGVGGVNIIMSSLVSNPALTVRTSGPGPAVHGLTLGTGAAVSGKSESNSAPAVVATRTLGGPNLRFANAANDQINIQLASFGVTTHTLTLPSTQGAAGTILTNDGSGILTWSDSGLSAHLADAIDAHDASAISNIPSGNLAATNVQSALNELQIDIDTNNTSLSSHTSNPSGAHAASAISNVPVGNLAAINVQSALNELQSDIDLRELAANKGVAGGYASLDGGGKIPVTQLPSALMSYEGTWNASTNTPTLANGTGDVGQVYTVSVAGTTNFGAGAITFGVGDWVIYSGTIWQRSDNVDDVVSVNGYIGTVVLTKADVGLGNVDNTSDINKPISTATQAALDTKVNPAIGGSLASATTGSVLFGGAGNTFAQDNANLFWDDTTNRLGIGTSTPATRLHVLGGTTSLNSVGTNGTALIITSDVLSDPFYSQKLVEYKRADGGLLSDRYYLYGGAALTDSMYVPYDLRYTGSLSFSGSGSIEFYGAKNFNAQTTATIADQIIRINPTNYATAAIPLTDSYLDFNTHAWNGVDGSSLSSSTRFKMSQLSATTEDIRFDIQTGPSASSRLAILGASGNVGIGTTNPAAKLHVNGTIAQGTTTNYVEKEYIHAITLTGGGTAVTATEFTFAHSTFEGIEISYKVKDQTTLAVRTGTLYVATNGITASITDQFTETSSVGVLWTAVVSGGNVEIKYTTTINNKVLRADVRRFLT